MSGATEGRCRLLPLASRALRLARSVRLVYAQRGASVPFETGVVNLFFRLLHFFFAHQRRSLILLAFVALQGGLTTSDDGHEWDEHQNGNNQPAN